MSEGVEPDCGATPSRDLDSLEILYGDVDFQAGTNGLADVTINIPPVGQGEQPGTNFTLWGQDNGGSWTELANDSARPRVMAGGMGYTAGAPFGVKVTFDRGGPSNRSGSVVAIAGRDESIQLT